MSVGRRFSILFVLVLGLIGSTVAWAGPVEHVRTIHDVDWTSAGVGGVGGFEGEGGAASISLSGITGSVEKAYLYWHGIHFEWGEIDEDSGEWVGTYDNPTVYFEGQEVTGEMIGEASSNCWGAGYSRAYRADVTEFVTGDGTFEVTGLASEPEYDVNGVSLVVIFDDEDPTNDRDLVFFEGNDSNRGGAEEYPGQEDGWHAVLEPITYGGGEVFAQFHVADGQDFKDAPLTFSSTEGELTIEPEPDLWHGQSVPTMGHSRASNGELWDIHTFELTEIFGDVEGSTSLTMDGMRDWSLSQNEDPDCLGLIVLILDLEAGTAPTPSCGDGALDDGQDCDGDLFQPGLETCPEGSEGSPVCSELCTLASPLPDGCTCIEGFEFDEETGACVDIDECAEGIDTCGDNATCTNTEPGYECTCIDGFELDGETGNCVYIDECAEGIDTCSDNATCINTVPGYDCICMDGFEGDGFTCEEVVPEDTVPDDDQADDPSTEDGDQEASGCGCSAGAAAPTDASFLLLIAGLLGLRLRRRRE